MYQYQKGYHYNHYNKLLQANNFIISTFCGVNQLGMLLPLDGMQARSELSQSFEVFTVGVCG